jgi:hypothetical protein
MTDIHVHFKKINEEQIKIYIKNKTNFVMDVDRGDLMQACARIEKCCDECGYTSRVYTKGRLGLSAAAWWFPPALVWTAIATAAHNVATLNPDFEIARNIITNTVTVTYKK